MVSLLFAMKRTSGGLHKRVARMALGDQQMSSDDDKRHQETGLDDIDWKVFRGPPDYTHVSLPAIFVNNINLTQYKIYEAGIRLTSPYEPFFSTQATQVGVVSGATVALKANGVSPFNTQFYGLYQSMYNYYSVMGCRYTITAENYGSEPIWMHLMHYNQESPPLNASNEDIQLWKGTTSYYMTPHATFYGAATGGLRLATDGYNIEDTGISTAGDTANSGTNGSYGVSRQNNAVIVHSDRYKSGDFRREIALDDDISTWTSVNSSPNYPENLLIRFNTDEASTGLAGDSGSRNRRLQINLRIKVEYLIEFKELQSAIRYPVQRDPITVTQIALNEQ
jgi:hypothetical protein